MPTPNGQPVVLLGDTPGEGPVLSLPTWVWRWRRLFSLGLKTVWLAGDPERRVVVLALQTMASCSGLDGFGRVGGVATLSEKVLERKQEIDV